MLQRAIFRQDCEYMRVLNAVRGQLDLQVTPTYYSRWWTHQWDALVKLGTDLGLDPNNFVRSEESAKQRAKTRETADVEECREYRCATTLGLYVGCVRLAKTLKEPQRSRCKKTARFHPELGGRRDTLHAHRAT